MHEDPVLEDDFGSAEGDDPFIPSMSAGSLGAERMTGPLASERPGAWPAGGRPARQTRPPTPTRPVRAPRPLAQSPDAAPNPNRLRNEALILAGCFLVGLLVSPALFWTLARKLIGPYLHGTDPTPLGVGPLLKDYMGLLGHGSLLAWTVLVGPALMLTFVRVMWALLRPRAD